MSDRAQLTNAVFVRLAGFSIARLEALRLRDSIEAAQRWHEAQTGTRAIAAEALVVINEQRFEDNPALADQHLKNRLLRLLRKISSFADGGPVPDQALFQEVAVLLPGAAGAIAELVESLALRIEAERSFYATFERDLDRAANELASAFADPLLQEAVFMESPAAFEGVRALLAGGPRNSKRRQRERTAIAYLQRFAAKNDTNSICGPVALSFLDAGSTQTGVRLLRDIVRRQTYFSFWAAEELRAFFDRRRDPEMRPFQRLPSARLIEDADGPRLQWCTIAHDATHQFQRSWSRAALPPAAAAVFQGASRPVTTAQLVESLSHLHQSEDIEAAIAGLFEAGVLRDRPLLPTGAFDPLRSLEQNIEARPAVDRLRLSLEQFATGDLPLRIRALDDLNRSFEDITAVSPHRGEGAHYADRGLVHEDAGAEVELTVSAGDRRDLQTAVDALVSVAALPLDLAREKVRAWFLARFGQGRVPALEVHRAFDRNQPYDRPTDTPRARSIHEAISAVRDEIARAIAEARGGPAQLKSAVLRSIAERAGPSRPGFASADLMLRSSQEQPRWVLGEVHGFFLLPTFWLPVMAPEGQERTLAELRSAMSRLADGRPTLEALFLHTQATDRRIRIADRDLLIAGASEGPATLFGDLDMQLIHNELRFFLGDEEVVPISPYTVYPFLTYTSPVAPLVDDFAGRFFPSALLPDSQPNADTPRLVLDGTIVFRREAHTRTAATLSQLLSADTEAARFLAAQRLRASLGGARWFFVSIPGEPKPVLLDFENLFLIEIAARAIKRSDPLWPIRFVEMLPGPSDLGLLGPDGPRTFEIRAGILRAI